MGLVLAALAAAIRSRWFTAGICIGLALCTKQYVFLAAVPLYFAAPRQSRWRLLCSTLATAAIVLIPFGIAMGKGLVDAVTGAYATTTSSGTLVAALDLHGMPLLAVSRVLPLALAGLLAMWARSHLKAAVCEPKALVSLIATSLALRLVFETNLFSYYFMATAVSLIAVDIVVGRLRLATFGWIVASTAFFPPAFLPPVLVVEKIPQLVQLALVGFGLVLAVSPLRQAISASSNPEGSASFAEFAEGMTVTAGPAVTPEQQPVA